jgi:hypothetical protein
MPARTRAKLTTKIESKLTSYPHRQFIKHLVTRVLKITAGV